MASSFASIPSAAPPLADDRAIWDSLQSAIATSSGFQRWRSEQSSTIQANTNEVLVRRYLRETLETLAY